MESQDKYDVIVIGAGLAGALTARYLADGGMQVVVLEATPSPGGAAKTQYLLSLLGTAEPYSELARRWGQTTALRIWDLTRENLHAIKISLDETGHDSKYTGSIRPTASKGDVSVWQESVASLQNQGYEIELELTYATKYDALMYTFDDIVFDNQTLVMGLLDHPGIIVEYGVEVSDIKTRQEGDLAIWGYKRYLWGDKVVLANGIHAIRLQNSLSKLMKPCYTHTIEVHNVPTLKHPMILHRGSVSIIPAGDCWYVTGWGCGEKNILKNMISIASDFCPDAQVNVRHTGWVAESNDNIPFIGKLPEHANIYTINGLGAFGASWVFMAAKQLADLILHSTQPRFLNISRLYSD